MPRHARLTLLQRLRQVGDAQRALGTQRQQAQPTGLTGRAQPLQQLGWGDVLH